MARRPNGRPVFAMSVESEARDRQDGFRGPGWPVVEYVGAARDHDCAAPTPRVRRPAPVREPTRSVLKMKRFDPPHPCVSAAMGVGDVGPPRGRSGIGDEVRPRAALVDQLWIRIAIHSQGSAP